MFSFLKNSTPKDAAVPGSALVSTQQDSAPQSVQPHTDIKRELIRVVLKDTLRQQSIPYEWIGCEISNIATGTADEQFHIQLVVMKWSELLMRYAMALQKQLLRGLDRMIQVETGLSVTVAKDPLLAVAKGTGIVLEEMDSLSRAIHSSAKRSKKW